MAEDITNPKKINRIKMFEFGHRGYEQITKNSTIRHSGNNLGGRLEDSRK